MPRTLRCSLHTHAESKATMEKPDRIYDGILSRKTIRCEYALARSHRKCRKGGHILIIVTRQDLLLFFFFFVTSHISFPESGEYDVRFASFLGLNLFFCLPPSPPTTTFLSLLSSSHNLEEFEQLLPRHFLSLTTRYAHPTGKEKKKRVVRCAPTQVLLSHNPGGKPPRGKIVQHIHTRTHTRTHIHVVIACVCLRMLSSHERNEGGACIR